MKPFVLVVDDSLSVRMELRQAFVNANFSVAACGTLLTARQVLKSRNCDLAVLDLMLPDGNGSELLHEIKQHPELRHVPVIVLSATASHSASHSAANVAAEKYIDKPCPPNQLVKLAESLCAEHMGGKKFLIVDDSPTFLHALGVQLIEYGNEVLTATSGEEALELLSKHQVDCAVVDMVMPGIGGLETCRQLRKRPENKDLVVVMLTATENPSGRSQRLSVGADAFLLKSHHFDKLCVQLRAMIRKKQPSRPQSEIVHVAPPPKTLQDDILAILGPNHSMAQIVFLRAARSMGLLPDSVTAQVIPELIPSLRTLLGMFMKEAEIEERMDALRALSESYAANSK